MHYRVERQIGDKTLTMETGKYAQQANGTVTVRCGDTILLATAVVAPHPRQDIDFLPLTVDYEERLYAMGKIPGSFFRREGRPGQDAVIFGRLTDRPMRPLFPKGFYNDVQVVITILSVDLENPPEVLGIVGASAAVSMSEIPFQGPISATRVTQINGDYIINPTYDEMNQGNLSVVIAGTRDAIMMIESESTEVSEEVVLAAIRRGQENNVHVIDMIDEMVNAVGKPKMAFTADNSHQALDGEVNTILNGRLSQVLDNGWDKVRLEQALHELEAEVQERLGEEHPKNKVAAAFESVIKRETRSRILERGIRPDGRGLADIRPISCEVGVLPRTHGSGLFSRGQTQVLSIATLASTGMRQTLDNLSPQGTRRYMHHYNFPPYSTGEVKRMGSSGRREIGHGALAERALESVVPSEEEFPYTIRVVSEVLSSNGSTSMASVCGSTLALMDAGVPIKKPVAGVAMGLIMGEDGNYAVLTDIQGIEDHLGDMDFKVAGTLDGINALQMDIKVKGLTYDVLERALQQARDGRLFILEKMREAITEPRPSLSPYAPKVFRMVIPVDKIGALIGPGGRTIRAIQEETGVSIDTEDDGTVLIGASDEDSIKKARDRVDALTRELAVGDIFTGKVARLTSFGAFVELLPGKDGLVRMEDLGDIENGVQVGQEITVIVQEIDHLGRINLSRKALFGNQDGPQGEGNRPPRPPQDRGRPGSSFGSRGPGAGGDRRPMPGPRGPRSSAGPDRRPPPSGPGNRSFRR